MPRKKFEPHPLIQNDFFLKNERDWSHYFLDYDIILIKELLGCLDIGYWIHEISIYRSLPSRSFNSAH